jgi:predicted nucleotidyltransferase
MVSERCEVHCPHGRPITCCLSAYLHSRERTRLEAVPVLWPVAAWLAVLSGVGSSRWLCPGLRDHSTAPARSVSATICDADWVGDRDQSFPTTRVATAFSELNDLLATFVGRVRAILETKLVGVYLTGSFALGGGDPASDCDFVVITSSRLSAEPERALRHLHEEIPDWPGYWSYNLEGSYAPRADLQTLAALGRPWLYVNRGAREMEWSAHCNTEDVRWVLRERPSILVGTDPRDFVHEVPVSALEAKMRPRIETFVDDLLTWTSFDISWTQRYAVEATLRMLYTLERGEVILKQDALDWGAAAMPSKWRELIGQVRSDRFVAWNDPSRPGSVERTLAFVEYVQQRARTGARPDKTPGADRGDEATARS